MKRKHIIIIVVAVIIGLIYLYVLALGYGGGKAAKPVEPTDELITLEKKIKYDTQYDGSYIDTPRNYEISNCSGNMKQEISLDINNESLKNSISLEKYVISINKKIQSIFPYDKNCYDSVIIKAQYFDKAMDSTINKRYSFPMIK